MASWLRHPRYVVVRDALIKYLRSDRYRFRRLAPVVFLCGGAESLNRDNLRDYVRKRRPELGLFYAERAWEQIAARSGLGALKMEADLAALADLVVIIVESPGTFAELGAFSLSDPLRKKLLAIVDEQYMHSQSFLSTGPLAWIDQQSEFRPTIYVGFPHILDAVEQIEERINRIRKTSALRLSDLATSPKHLLFFLCDLLAVIQPATMDVLEYYAGEIAPSTLSGDINIPTLIGLAVAMDLVRPQTLHIGGTDSTFFTTLRANALEKPFHHKRMIDLPSQRAVHVSVLQTIPEARAVLSLVRGT